MKVCCPGLSQLAEAVSVLALLASVCLGTRAQYDSSPKICVCFLDYDDISNQIDFIICLGGDGTLLYASSLFQVRLCFSVLRWYLGTI